MHIDEQELATTYGRCSDDELGALAAEMETLTDAARAALRAEIQQRGMSGAELEKLHSKELHREARFDQVETIRRKKLLLSRLTGWMWACLFLLGLIAFKWLRSRFHQAVSEGSNYQVAPERRTSLRA
jgi:hypothetical protein